MKLVDLDTEVVKSLSAKGFAYALVKPLQGTGGSDLAKEVEMEVIPFHDFGEASHHLDSLEEEEIFRSIIVEMDSKLADTASRQRRSMHLVIDLDAFDLKEAS